MAKANAEQPAKQSSAAGGVPKKSHKKKPSSELIAPKPKPKRSEGNSADGDDIGDIVRQELLRTPGLELRTNPGCKSGYRGVEPRGDKGSKGQGGRNTKCSRALPWVAKVYRAGWRGKAERLGNFWTRHEAAAAVAHFERSGREAAEACWG